MTARDGDSDGPRRRPALEASRALLLTRLAPRRYSYGAIAFCGCLTTYVGIIEYQHLMHPHEDHTPEYSHLKIRAKPYPWACPDCNLFESACWRACKDAAN